MAEVYTIKVAYEGCEDKIWREIQISSNAFLCQLGYAVLASFETKAYQPFLPAGCRSWQNGGYGVGSARLMTVLFRRRARS